jgi:thiamine biosynthesis lipoprotein
MGTSVHVLATASTPGAVADVLYRARERIEDLEARWSRFRPTSEVSVLNTLAGTAVTVSAETVVLVRRALDAYTRTGGRFDPTVLGDVARAGYDRTWDALDGRPGRDERVRGATDIVVDPVARRVRLPEGVGFDPGGIGKGLAADIVVAELAGEVDGLCVNVGGDLRVTGRAPLAAGWTVEIEHPCGAASPLTVCLREGAVATSSRTRRVLPEGHHLIDPSTGRPAANGVASATAIAGQAWIAEALAKAAFLAGPDDGVAALAAGGAEGLLVLDDGAVRATSGLGAFRVGEVAA